MYESITNILKKISILRPKLIKTIKKQKEKWMNEKTTKKKLQTKGWVRFSGYSSCKKNKKPNN